MASPVPQKDLCRSRWQRHPWSHRSKWPRVLRFPYGFPYVYLPEKLSCQVKKETYLPEQIRLVIYDTTRKAPVCWYHHTKVLTTLLHRIEYIISPDYSQHNSAIHLWTNQILCLNLPCTVFMAIGRLYWRDSDRSYVSRLLPSWPGKWPAGHCLFSLHC